MSCLELQLIQLRQGQGSAPMDTDLIRLVPRTACELGVGSFRTLPTLHVGGEEGREEGVEEKRRGDGFRTQWEALGNSREPPSPSGSPPLIILLLGLRLVCSGVGHSRINHCHMVQGF